MIRHTSGGNELHSEWAAGLDFAQGLLNGVGYDLSPADRGERAPAVLHRCESILTISPGMIPF